MITIVLSPVSSSLKTTEYHPNANFTRLISGFSGSVRHPDILCSYTCVYVTHNIYIYIYIHTYICIYIHTYIYTYIHTYMDTYIQTDRHRYIDTQIHILLCQNRFHLTFLAVYQFLVQDSFLVLAAHCFYFHTPQRILSYFQNLKHPSSALQKSNSHLVFGDSN